MLARSTLTRKSSGRMLPKWVRVIASIGSRLRGPAGRDAGPPGNDAAAIDTAATGAVLSTAATWVQALLILGALAPGAAAGVLPMPGSWLSEGGAGHLRLALVPGLADCEEAARRLRAAHRAQGGSDARRSGS